MNEDKNKQLFLSLIYSFQMQAMMQMGKLQNPMTGEIENELEAAQVTIDMLDMMKEKTKNNISEDESGFLTKVISDLKLNYVEELTKKKSEPKEEPVIDEVTGNAPSSEEKSEDKKEDGESEDKSDSGNSKEVNADPKKSGNDQG